MIILTFNESNQKWLVGQLRNLFDQKTMQKINFRSNIKIKKVEDDSDGTDRQKELSLHLIIRFYITDCMSFFVAFHLWHRSAAWIHSGDKRQPTLSLWPLWSLSKFGNGSRSIYIPYLYTSVHTRVVQCDKQMYIY